jgi:hypothetical protein
MAWAYYNLCGNCDRILDGKNGEEHTPPNDQRGEPFFLAWQVQGRALVVAFR